MANLEFLDNLFPTTNVEIQDVKGFLSTGYPPLNKALSGSYLNGGFPIGRISEVYGEASSGKTLLATMCCVANQKRGGLCIWLDYEHSFSLSYAKQLGLTDDPKLWRYASPETAEEGFSKIKELGDYLLENKIKDSNILVVIDSVPSMVTLEEDNLKHIEDANMRSQLALASFLSRNMKWVARTVSNTGMTVILLNQVRSNPNPFTPDESTPGGKAIKFYASTRLRLIKKKKEIDGNEVIGERVDAETVKNKVFKPYRKTSWVTDFKYGININLSVIEFLVDSGYLKQGGGWITFNDSKFRKKEMVDLMDKDESFKTQVFDLFNELEQKEKEQE
jgi:protein RecA